MWKINFQYEVCYPGFWKRVSLFLFEEKKNSILLSKVGSHYGFFFSYFLIFDLKNKKEKVVEF